MSQIDQLQQRINFFESSAEAKEKISKSESDRLRLEIELNRLINSDNAIAKSKANRLKAYFTKLCDEEAKSLKRNQQILSDLKRVDSHFQQLEIKLERLNNVKNELEVYFKTVYPVWTNENKLFEPKPTGISMLSGTQLEASALGRLLLPDASNSKYYNDVYNYNDNASSQTINTLMDALRPNKERVKFEENRISDNLSPPSSPTKYSTIKNLIIAPSYNSPLTTPKQHATPTAESSSTTRSKQVHHNGQAEMADSPNQYIQNLVRSANVIVGNSESSSKPQSTSPTRKHNATTTKHDESSAMLMQSGNQYLATNVAENNLLREYEQELKLRDTNMLDFNASSTLNLNHLSNSNEFNQANQEAAWQLSQMHRSVSPPNKKSQPETNKSLSNMIQDENKNSSLRQELNLNSLYYLLDFIELEISHTIHPEKYYRQVEPHYKNKLEIIRLARENKPLDEMDPADISMVILDQLPIVIEKNTKNKCLFTRDLLGLSVTDISERLVSKSLRDESDRHLWDRLIKHWSFLRKIAYIDSITLAKLFAPALLGSAASNGSEKCVKFLEKIINDTSVTNVLNESKSLTETSINQELLVAANSKLKESSVYQDFIMSTHSSNKSKQARVVERKSDDDSDDEIDTLVAPKSMMSTNSASNRVQNQGPLVNTSIIKSPRGANDFDFDFSQNSISDSQKVPKVLQSLRSSGDKNKIPVHLRNPDSEDESSEDISAKIKGRSQKSDLDFEFYN